jgi:hypothetical protein
MLEMRVKQLERLVPFVRKEVAEKEAVKKKATEKEASKKEDDDDEEDQQSRSRDDDGPVCPIRVPRIKSWFKCPICVNYLYEHKNILLFHIKNFINDAMSLPNVVEQHCHLWRLLKATMRNL